MYKVYGDIYSGNCYKVALLLHLTATPYEWIPVAILDGETGTAEFLRKNPNGKIPLLEIESGEWLPESNAILNFLAEGTEYLPAGGLPRARVLQWQFFEQYSHEPSIAVARFIKRYLNDPPERRLELELKQAAGHKALAVMEQQLNRTAYIAGATFTIADISLYAYTHVAHEGGFELAAYPAIQRWIDRIEGRTGHMTMQQAAALLNA